MSSLWYCLQSPLGVGASVQGLSVGVQPRLLVQQHFLSTSVPALTLPCFSHQWPVSSVTQWHCSGGSAVTAVSAEACAEAGVLLCCVLVLSMDSLCNAGVAGVLWCGPCYQAGSKMLDQNGKVITDPDNLFSLQLQLKMKTKVKLGIYSK